MDQRRYDLDWLRIGAFALLIFYHVGMFYVTWDFHVKSSRASHAIEPLMLLVNPWRLSLLFLISGAATRFMADKMQAGRLAWSRLGRLVPPLVLAVFVIVPPQSYYEVVEAIAQGAPLTVDHFYWRYITASGGWCDADGCLITPTYNHMWFVAYLILYTLALIVLLPLLRRTTKGLGVLLAGPGLLLTPWLFLWALRVTLFPRFGETHALVDDWYLHAVSFSAFLFGFAIAKHDRFFQACMHWRWCALALAVGGWAGVLGVYAVLGDAQPAWASVGLRGLRELQAWCAIVAALGFAHRHLRGADGPVRRVLTQAIFPFYLIHQTIIVVAGHTLDALGLPLGLEVALLLASTALGCGVFFVLGRRLGPLRIWVGLPSKISEKSDKNRGLAAGEAS